MKGGSYRPVGCAAGKNTTPAIFFFALFTAKVFGFGWRIATQLRRRDSCWFVFCDILWPKEGKATNIQFGNHSVSSPSNESDCCARAGHHIRPLWSWREREKGMFASRVCCLPQDEMLHRRGCFDLPRPNSIRTRARVIGRGKFENDRPIATRN